jgi:WD40 repeat protein
MHPEDPASPSLVLPGPQAPIEEIWFSPDGKWLASSARAEDAWSVHLWDLSDGDFRTRPFHLPGQFFPKQFPPLLPPFSPNAKWLLTITADGPVRLWDLTDEDPSANPVVLRGHVGMPLATAFSPDGRWLATGGATSSQLLLQDETVRLWDLSNPDTGIDCVVLRGYASRCAAVTFTADSHHLVTRCDDGEVRVWDLRLDKLIELARRAAGRQLTPEEREKYLLSTTP